jgi:hypothetical protein
LSFLFLAQSLSIYPLLFVDNFLSPIAEPQHWRFPRATRRAASLSLAKAPAARRRLVKGLSLNFTDNRVPFALKLLMAKVLMLLPRLRTLNVVSVHENPRPRARMDIPA